MNHELAAILRSEDDGFRSGFVRDLVQCPVKSRQNDRSAGASIPKTIIQFWDDPCEIPDDVRLCLESWQQLCGEGFGLARFDDSSARRFVADNLESCHLKALDACYHPAMRSDYFRLCYVGLRGGCYVDADDIYSGQSLDVLFGDGRLKLQPLCYDVLSDAMVPPEVFTRLGAGSQNWIFY